MFRPVLVEKPTALPISIADVKAALRIGSEDFDAEIERYIQAAVNHFEGWSGVLGICLMPQTWRQDYGRFEQKMALAIGPVQSVIAVRSRNAVGQISTVAAENYALKRDAGGAYIRFVNAFAAPSDLYEESPVSIEYLVGWPMEDDKPGVPSDIQTAIILFVQKLFDEAARSSWDALDRAEKSLVSKYRVPSL